MLVLYGNIMVRLLCQQLYFCQQSGQTNECYEYSQVEIFFPLTVLMLCFAFSTTQAEYILQDYKCTYSAATVVFSFEKLLFINMTCTRVCRNFLNR